MRAVRYLIVVMTATALIAYGQVKIASAQPALTQAQVDRYRELTDQATAIANRYIIIEGRPSAAPNVAELERAISLYDEALRIHDGRYGVWWMRGKIYQALERPREAFDSFRRAYQLEPNNQPIVNEMTIQAVELGELDFALEATTRGLQSFPNDLPLSARLALVQLLRGYPEEAVAAADRALVISPNDFISQQIRRIAVEVQSGARPQPRTIQDLQRN